MCYARWSLADKNVMLTLVLHSSPTAFLVPKYEVVPKKHTLRRMFLVLCFSKLVSKVVLVERQTKSDHRIEI